MLWWAPVKYTLSWGQGESAGLLDPGLPQWFSNLFSNRTPFKTVPKKTTKNSIFFFSVESQEIKQVKAMLVDGPRVLQTQLYPYLFLYPLWHFHKWSSQNALGKCWHSSKSMDFEVNLNAHDLITVILLDFFSFTSVKW